MAKALSEAGANIALVARDRSAWSWCAMPYRSGGTAAVFTADVTQEDEVASAGGSRNSALRSSANSDQQRGNEYPQESGGLFAGGVSQRSGLEPDLDISDVPRIRAGHEGSGYGRILNMTSIMSHVSLPGRTAYSSAKAALLGFTRALALELAGEGITVNGISPGPLRNGHECGGDEQSGSQCAVPRQCAGWDGGARSEEIGALACYLCSEAAGFITGTDILIDGGWTAK
jgi:NAD(P)-dependent dehydrogenase (short-subunit alcohol dehydrogenase family)